MKGAGTVHNRSRIWYLYMNEYIITEITDGIIKLCKEYRMNVLGMTQADVANELGYTRTNISEFENGRNRNFAIFLWYIGKGLPLSNVERIVKNEQKAKRNVK